jgi:hypothetical protein
MAATPEQTAMLMFLLGLGGLLGIGSAASQIWRNMRGQERTPPLPEELAKTYCTKDELQKCREECRSRCDKKHEHQDKIDNDLFILIREERTLLMDRMDKMSSELKTWQIGISQQVGRLEAADERRRK